MISTSWHAPAPQRRSLALCSRKVRLYPHAGQRKGAGSRVMSRLEFHRIRGVVNGMRFGPRLDVKSLLPWALCLAVRRSGDRGILSC